MENAIEEDIKKIESFIKENIEKHEDTIRKIDPKNNELPENQIVKTTELTDKSFTGEIRGLLNDYPKELSLVNSFDFIEITKNFIVILDCLNYCKVKTTKEDIRDKIKEELKLFESIKVDKLRILLGEIIGNSSEYIKNTYIEEIKQIILPNISLVTDKVQFFFNCIPAKGKSYKHYRTAQGFPAHTAEEYESPEIEAGEKIKEGQQFKIEEGVVIPI